MSESTSQKAPTTFTTPGLFQKDTAAPAKRDAVGEEEAKNVTVKDEVKKIDDKDQAFPIAFQSPGLFQFKGKETPDGIEGFPVQFDGPGLFQREAGEKDDQKTVKKVTQEILDNEKPTEKLTEFPMRFQEPGLFQKPNTNTLPSPDKKTIPIPKEEDRRVVFVCVDKSKFSKHVLEWCSRNLSLTDRVVLIHVAHFTPFPAGLYPSIAIDYVKENKRIRQAAHKQGHHFLKCCVAACHKLGFMPTETKLLLVNNRAMTIKHAILESTEHHNPDMIVVGTQGLGALGRAFLGSVSDYLVHNAPCSVTIVRQPNRKPVS
uniref:UspA domain-containing protein n=1 Tax=Lotharella oceanica TaxID=641309 RepID=A0A7S2X8P4_9EUKA